MTEQDTFPYDRERAAALQAEIDALRKRQAEAEAELLDVRFANVPLRAEGDLVLVRRRMFGKIRPVAGRITHVYRSYDSGIYDGTPWERQSVSYVVQFRLQDGSWGDRDSYPSGKVEDAPAELQEQPS